MYAEPTRPRAPSTHPPCVNGGPTNLISFLKPVAVSTAACSTVRNLDGAGFSQLEPPKMAVYSLMGNARSPFHAEPAQRLMPVARAYCCLLLIPTRQGIKEKRRVSRSLRHSFKEFS